MNALQGKIERYKIYIAHDHELIQAHPTKREYKNRLRNHQDKLNRLLEKRERELNPPPYIEPPHHPGITFSEYEALEKELERYAAELDELKIPHPADSIYSLLLCNEAGGPVEWHEATHASVEITEFDEQHDCSVLDDILKTVGIQVPVHPSEMWGGDSLTDWGTRRIAGYDIPLKK